MKVHPALFKGEGEGQKNEAGWTSVRAFIQSLALLNTKGDLSPTKICDILHA